MVRVGRGQGAITIPNTWDRRSVGKKVQNSYQVLSKIVANKKCKMQTYDARLHVQFYVGFGPAFCLIFLILINSF